MDLSILRYEITLAFRRLWRRPGQTGLLLTTFGISIALTLLSWSLFHTIFLKAPEFDPQGDLYIIKQSAKTPGARLQGFNREDIDIWKANQKVFSNITHMMMYKSAFVSTGDSSERLLGSILSSEALQMIGAKPLMGRLFTSEDDKFKCAPTVLLSEKTWRSRFDTDPNIIGRVIKVDGYQAEIVGVMPKTFRFPNSQDIWLPIGFNIWEWNQPDDTSFDALARLKPGVSPERATEDLRLIMANRGSETNTAKYDMQISSRPIREVYLESYMQRSAVVLFVLSLVFVIVSCANAANLVMIDFFGRSAELSSSMALGLPRWTAIRNICFQVAGIALIAGVIGSIVMMIASPYVHNALVLMVAPYWLKFDFAWHHIVAAIALGGISCLTAVMIPAIYLLVVSPDRIIRDGAGSSRGTGRSIWRRSLLIGQVALLTLLGVAATLLMQSNEHISEKHWGYDASKVFLGKLDVPRVDFATHEERGVIFRKVIAEMRRIPGVRDVAITFNPPGYSWNARTRYALDPATLTNGSEDGFANNITASHGFFNALGVPVIAGKAITEEPTEESWRDIIINESLAAKLWPGTDPIGRSLYVRFPWTDADEPTEQVTVRGMTRDFQAAGPKVPNNDMIAFSFGGWMPWNLFIIAGGYNSLPTTKEINDAVWRVDPRVVPYFPDSIKNQIDIALGYMRLTTKLTTIYALAAALLCGVGVYSITIAQILQRQREFGIRLALGIDPFRLWVRYARGHILTTAIGVAIGLVGAAMVMHTLNSMLFGVKALDLATFAIVAGAIILISALASIPSLYRLRRIKPADCLRSL